MLTTIKCKYCGKELEISDALQHEIQEEAVKNAKKEAQKEVEQEKARSSQLFKAIGRLD